MSHELLHTVNRVLPATETIEINYSDLIDDQGALVTSYSASFSPLPPGAKVAKTDVRVAVAFDVGTSCVIDVGSSATADLLIDNQDIKTSAGAVTELSTGWGAELASDGLVVITITSAGTVPTAGKLIATVHYYLAAAKTYAYPEIA